jgi:hypothetical protein
MPRRAVLLLLPIALLACRSDERMRAMLAERAQLQREIAGFRALDTVMTRGLLADSNEIVLSVSDSVVRAVLSASMPIDVSLAGQVQARLTGITLAFRGNVARVVIQGTAVRDRFPRAAAKLELRGALERFRVDSAEALHASIRLDDATLASPRGVPYALDGAALALLQIVVDRALPQLGAALPELTLPVRLDRALNLPGFGPEGALTVQPARALLSMRASRVLAYRNRLTVVLRVERGPLLTVMP